MPHTAKLLIRDVVEVKPNTSVSEAVRIMKRANVGAVIVSESGSKPLGILSERDVARRIVAEDRDPRTTPVSEVMTRDVVTVESSEGLNRVFACLAEGRFRHLPVTEGGAVVGIVSLSDLAKVLGQVYEEDRYLQYFADVIQAR